MASTRCYYGMTLVATEDNQRLWSVQSHYAGPSERYKGWERRAPSIVDPEKMCALWEGIGQSWLAVHDRLDVYLWIRLGGNALVQTTLAQRRPSDWVGVREVAPNGPIGFLNARSLTAEDGVDVPTRRVGKQVARRDGGRCCRCGRGDVEMTKHHVLPYGAGGLTQESNLVLLCNECHEPLHTKDTWHPDPLLQGVLLGHADLDEDYVEGVQRHRRLIAQIVH